MPCIVPSLDALPDYHLESAMLPQSGLNRISKGLLGVRPDEIHFTSEDIKVSDCGQKIDNVILQWEGAVFDRGDWLRH